MQHILYAVFVEIVSILVKSQKDLVKCSERDFFIIKILDDKMHTFC